MYKGKSILAVVPARGGSKRLPKKNILPLAGKPLIAHTIDVAAACSWIDRIVVSTDSRAIKNAAIQAGAEVVMRPARLASDRAHTITAVLHVLDRLAREAFVPDMVVLLQPTSPLRTVADIRAAIRLYTDNPCQSVASVCPAAPYWTLTAEPFTKPLFGWKFFTGHRKQDLPDAFRVNGVIYISSPAALKKHRSFYNRRTLPYVMPEERSVDIDTALDLTIAEAVLHAQRNH